MKFKSNHEEFIYLSGYVDGSRNQANLMYNDEEVLEILYKHTEDLLAGKKITLEQWFKKFKK